MTTKSVFPFEKRAVTRVPPPGPEVDDLAFVQGVEVTGVRTLYLAGAVSSDEDGKTLHPGDVRARVLAAADMEWGHVERLDRVGCRAAGTLLGVEHLASDDLLCEFEATAVAP